MTSPHKASAYKILKSPKLARANWLYMRSDVLELYGVCPNTVRNWIRQGLVSFDAKGRLFRGAELNAFHRERQKAAKRPCSPFEIFCLCCKQKHSLLDTSFTPSWIGRFRTKVVVRCPETGGTTQTFISETNLDELRQRLKRSLSSQTAT